MKLSVIIPAFNEENTILEVIKNVEKIIIPETKKEIIVVDDCSKDKTREILGRLKIKDVKIAFHDKNMGKGAAIRTGLKIASGDYVIIQDADLEYNPEDYSKLIEIAKKKKARVVYGSRMLNKDNKYSYKSYYLGNFFLNIATNLIYSAKITDMETCYKLIEKKLLEDLNLKSRRFDIEPEITSKILRRKIKIYEVPISYTPRSKSEGKKIKWKDGIYALFTLIKYRFSN